MLTTRKKKITLADIAASANVSKMTVANALSAAGGKTTRVSEATASRIRKIAAQMNYRPNLIARQLRSQRTGVVGVIVDSCAPLLAYERLAYVEKMLSRRGYRVIVGQSHNRIEQLRKHVDDFVSRNVEGIISLAHSYPNVEDVFDIHTHMQNVVLIGKPHFDCQNLSYVGFDVEDGAFQAASYLLGKGCRKIATLLYGSEYQSTQCKHKGVVRAMSQVGLELDESMVWDLGTEALFQQDVDALLKSKLSQGLPEAIITTNDKLAIMAIKSIKKLGISVPGDIAVTGFDNTELASLSDPELTTVAQNDPEISEKAVEMLISMINSKGKFKPQHITMESRLVVRESA